MNDGSDSASDATSERSPVGSSEPQVESDQQALPSTSERARRDGRGRLSSVEMLPAECREDVVWVNAELRERTIPQTEILDRFNARLSAKGQPPISKGAFSRYSVRVSRKKPSAVEPEGSAETIDCLKAQIHALQAELLVHRRLAARTLRAIERVERTILKKGVRRS